MMSDDVPLKQVVRDEVVGVATVSEDDLALPPYDQIETMSRKELRRRIRGLIELVRRIGRGEANPKGGMPLALAAAQYLTEELARRNQDRQAKVMTEHTKTVKDYTVMIGIMTILVTIVSFVSMIATVWGMVHSH